MSPARTSALQGYTVLELCEDVSGEYCGKLLADFGARVMKIERPGCGSPTRALAPFARSGDDPERSGLYAYLNTNKCSLALDVHSQKGASALAQLLQHVDVVIDDHAVHWLRALDLNPGLDPGRVHETHPALVLCSITAYGCTDGNAPPEDRQHAHDLSVFHASGWGYHTPSGATDNTLPPLKGAGRFLPSYEAGLDAALCIVAALYERESSALGRSIDVSKQQVLASRADYVLAQMVAGDMPVSTARTAYDLHGPANIFPCRDGYVYIWMSAPAHWEALGKLLDHPAWMDDFPPHWLERECTAERVAQCRHHIAQWLRTQDKHAAAEAAQKLGLTLVAVNNASDLLASPQYQFRGYFSAVDHPVQGRALYPTVPYKLSATPARIDTPAPLLGQHSVQEMLQLMSARSQIPSDKPAHSRAGNLRGGPLQGVRVVELTKVWAGPYVGKLLAFLGAEVIRVESESAIDVTRVYGVSDINNAPGFQAVNTQKLSVQIDMKTAAGVGLILDLLRESDIVIENLRPGAVKRLGLDYDTVRAVNPAIVYVSMGMYGTQGPLCYQTGYAPCFAALGGLSALVGYEGQPPSGMNIRYADSTFGAMAAYGALVALLHRRCSGVGQFVDVSAVESMTSMIGDSIMDYVHNGALNGTVPTCDGNRHSEMAPHGAYPCRDGEWLSIAVASDGEWAALASAMGQAALAADPRFACGSGRQAHREELDSQLAQWTINCDASELSARLQHLGIAATRSQSSIDMIADPHLWARGFYQQVSDGSGQTKTTLGPAWKMSRAAHVTAAAPRLGEHNAYVFGDILGLSREQQQQLAAAGVTR